MIRQSVIIFVHALPNIILRMQFERLEKEKEKEEGKVTDREEKNKNTKKGGIIGQR